MSGLIGSGLIGSGTLCWELLPVRTHARGDLLRFFSPLSALVIFIVSRWHDMHVYK